MQIDSQYILSVAGLDPCGGAGLFADIKVFEQYGLYGLGVATCITYQNDTTFSGVKWLDNDEVLNQLRPLAKFPVNAVKIGLVESFESLLWLSGELKGLWPEIKIIWDPILKASAGFTFHRQVDQKILADLLRNIHCITPNLEEAEKLGDLDAYGNARQLSHHCDVILKGGHNQQNADDILFKNGNAVQQYSQAKIDGLAKHGSGCVFSSALAASIAEGHSIEEACRNGKDYTLAFLKSTGTLLGRHNNLPLLENG